MGQVWAARRHESNGAPLVALKTPLDELDAGADFERVFVDEARLASSIMHPNVCTIHEFGSDAGVAYLVMEWVNGGTLHDILTASPTRRIDYYAAAQIAASVCGGLHAAHELVDADGTALCVVHRDVSPQNILVSDSGQVKIADFGVARAKGQLHRPTRSGELKGKLSYMAPEQLTSKEFDRRADVFALGSVLYQATTGQRPFHGDDTLETMYKLLETDCPRPSELIPDYPMRLETIVMTALAKDSSARYQTAAQFEDELRRFLAARGMLAVDNIVELVQSSLGEAIRQKRSEIDAAIASLESHTEPPPLSRRSRAPHSTAPAAVRFSSAPSAAMDSLRPSAPNPEWQPANPQAAGKSQRWTLSWIVLGALTLSSTATWFALRARRPTHAAGHTSHTSASADERVPNVGIDIATDPVNAWLRIDDGPIVQSPHHLEVTPSAVPHVIQAELDGHHTRQQTVAFDHSTRIVIQLQPLEPEHKPARSTRPTVPTATVLSPTVSIPTATSKTLELPLPRIRKPRRPLDPKNPF